MVRQDYLIGIPFLIVWRNSRVIRYSRIGNGGSEQLSKNYTSEEYAEEARLVLEALNIKNLWCMWLIRMVHTSLGGSQLLTQNGCLG